LKIQYTERSTLNVLIDWNLTLLVVIEDDNDFLCPLNKMIFSYSSPKPRDERTKVIFRVVIAASVCGLWLFFLWSNYYLLSTRSTRSARARAHVEMNKIQWENYSRLAHTMKEYQFFRLSTAAGLAPCLEQYHRRRAIQCRFGRIASGAVHRNGSISARVPSSASGFIRKSWTIVELLSGNSRGEKNFNPAAVWF
jgi:hypothetical protein